jgi:prepilin peptidase CpaA
MTTVSTVAFLALLGPACWFDVRERRIPNAVTVAGAIAALLLRVSLGWGPLLEGLLGAGLALLGGGDVKLLGAVGAFVGADRLFGGLLLIAVVGGVLALVEAVRQRALRRTLASTVALGKQWMLFGRAGVAPTLESPGIMAIPYGVAIAVGSLVWWFMGGTTL